MRRSTMATSRRISTAAFPAVLLAIFLLFYQHVAVSQLYPVERSGLFGYVDDAGRIVIPPEYEGARDFHQGVAAVQIRGKWGYIDRWGEIEILPQFEESLDFSEGLAAVSYEGRWGYIEWGYLDKKGGAEIPFQFDYAWDFQADTARVRIGNLETYIDRSGREVR